MALALALPNSAFAYEDCDKLGNNNDQEIKKWQQQKTNATTDIERQKADQRISSLISEASDLRRECIAQKDSEARKASDLETAKNKCLAQKNDPKIKGVYDWDPVKNTCINYSETKDLAESDECASASVFGGELKGQNCKKALQTVESVQSRSSALSDATTAATTTYANMQATGATGAQNDAQTRQANIMKTLALSKLATGAINLQGAMQLKGAAAGANDAHSTITSAEQALAAKCSGVIDEQACFYANAKSYGIEDPSQANFDRMRSAARQSQEQADAANAAAKQSMLTGAADMLVGLQAMRMAQMANQNAQQMAPPPAPPMRAPSAISLGGNKGVPALPTLAGEVAPKPVDYGVAPEDGMNFGDQKSAPIEGTMENAKMGTPTVMKAATSGVSGGGGGGGGGSGGRGGGGGAPPPKNGGKRNTASGEYSLDGAGGKGAPSAAKPDGANPLTDMLAKLFPQDQNGKPVVDARQIASSAGPVLMSDAEVAAESSVTATDLSIFEQISAKYRQLSDSGRLTAN